MKVTYILKDFEGLKDGWIVMGTEKEGRAENGTPATTQSLWVYYSGEPIAIPFQFDGSIAFQIYSAEYDAVYSLSVTRYEDKLVLDKGFKLDPEEAELFDDDPPDGKYLLILNLDRNDGTHRS